MILVDDVILAELNETLPFDLHDGQVTADNTSQVVTLPLPYATYTSSIGDDDNRRLSGRKARRSVFISITYVGIDRNQTKWAGEQIRALMQHRRFTIPGHKSWLCELGESQRIRRDDSATRPDGKPLFYGVDNYALSIALHH